MSCVAWSREDGVTKEFDNKKKRVPAYLLDPAVVMEDTIDELLVQSGFFTAAELGL